jgi:hypothetical protein
MTQTNMAPAVTFLNRLRENKGSVLAYQNAKHHSKRANGNVAMRPINNASPWELIRDIHLSGYCRPRPERSARQWEKYRRRGSERSYSDRDRQLRER